MANASRTGVVLTSNRRASSTCSRRSPARRRPAVMSARRAAAIARAIVRAAGSGSTSGVAIDPVCRVLTHIVECAYCRSCRCDGAAQEMRPRPMGGFEGRVAIVSGASSGMGEATARRLAREGAHLVLLAAPGDREDLARVAADLGGQTVAQAGDIADPATSREAVAAALDTFGRLDYVVNNAGIIGHHGFFEETIEEFDRMMAVNARGAYLLAIEAAKAMADGGAIVCTASVSSWLGEELQVAYNTSKGAVLMIVRTLGLELAPYGIRVNGVAPGYIRTRMSQARLNGGGYWDKARSRIPLDRPGEPDEVANVITFLLSSEASFMYGSVITVDGGQSAGMRSTDWAAAGQDSATRAPRRLIS